MKTRLSINNPFGYTRHGFAFEHILDGMKCLDYGCAHGTFMKAVKAYKHAHFIGVDKNRKVVSENPHKLEIVHVTDKLPFNNESFDCVTMLDVLEHIYDQNLVLTEVNRVLTTGGVLIVTVPRKYMFSLLDPKNLVFLLPTLSRWFMGHLYSQTAYNDWYVNIADGLIGSVEKEKGWHQHFSSDVLRELLEANGFKIDIYDGSCLFQRVFLWFDLFRVGFLFPKKLRELDSKKFEQMNLFCKAVKVGDPERGGGS